MARWFVTKGFELTRNGASKKLRLKRLMRTKYKDATKVILVCDNLNTHTPTWIMRPIESSPESEDKPDFGCFEIGREPATAPAEFWKKQPNQRNNFVFDSVAGKKRSFG